MTDTNRPVRVRVAPSPTGDPHVGTAYIALFNLAFARHAGGAFALRIEDTDRQRSSAESEQAILDALRWLGLDWDEGPGTGGPLGPYRQSERSDIYRREVRKLVDSAHAYPCFCSAERLAEVRKDRQARKASTAYDRRCRDIDPDEARRRMDDGEPHTIRLAVPLEGETIVVDRLRGPITFQNAEIDDQVLTKSDGFPTYHLASVADDHLMEITHVCRAEEWITSTPKHVLLYEAFGWPQPEWIHMPLLRNPDRSKISKRKNPVSLEWYRDRGYLPEALLNFLALLGYSMPGDTEVFGFDELVADFAWDRVKTSGPVFDLEKLAWLNGEYIRAMSPEAFARRARELGFVPEGMSPEVWQAAAWMIQERVKTLAEIADHTAYFTAALPYEPDDLLPKKKGKPTRDRDETRQVLEQIRAIFGEIADWTTESLETSMRAYCDESDWKTRELFMTLRVAITCRTVSTPLFETMEVLGRDESLCRLDDAVAKLQ